jgi:hypothetical protein
LAESYARAFGQLGHEVIRFDSDQAYFEAAWYARNRWTRRLLRPVLWNRLNRRTVEVVRSRRPDLVWIGKGPYLHTETVHCLRSEEGLPVVNYYPDNPYCGVPLDPRKTSAQRRDLIPVLREYTRVYTWDKQLVKRLESDGVHAAYVPFAADATVYRPMRAERCTECRSAPHAVVFVGQHDAKRQRDLGMIRAHQVGLWGARWRRAARRFNGRHVIHAAPAFGSACALLYGAAEVSLNVVNDLNMPGHNMRTFEIPASGGVMVSTYTAEQAEFFPEGEAAWYYRHPADLDDIIGRLRRDKVLRERTRDAALRIAREHDYRQRAEAILADIAA